VHASNLNNKTMALVLTLLSHKFTPFHLHSETSLKVRILL